MAPLDTQESGLAGAPAGGEPVAWLAQGGGAQRLDADATLARPGQHRTRLHPRIAEESAEVQPGEGREVCGEEPVVVLVVLHGALSYVDELGQVTESTTATSIAEHYRRYCETVVPRGVDYNLDSR